MSSLKTLPMASFKEDSFRFWGYSAKLKRWENEGRKGSGGKKDKRVRGTCLELCPKFVKRSPCSLPCFLPPPLKYPACFNQEGRGGKSNWARDQKLPYGDRLGPATVLTQRQSTKASSVSGNERLFVLRASLRFEWMWLAGKVGGCQHVP